MESREVAGGIKEFRYVLPAPNPGATRSKTSLNREARALSLIGNRVGGPACLTDVAREKVGAASGEHEWSAVKVGEGALVRAQVLKGMMPPQNVHQTSWGQEINSTVKCIRYSNGLTQISSREFPLASIVRNRVQAARKEVHLHACTKIITAL